MRRDTFWSGTRTKRVKVRFSVLDESEYRRITVFFCLSNVVIPMDEFVKMIGIEPCSTFSVFPEKSPNKPYWYTKVASDADNVEEPIREIIERIKPRLDVISRICTDYGIDASFVVQTRTRYAKRPAIEVSADLCSIMECLNAELSFDIAYEW